MRPQFDLYAGLNCYCGKNDATKPDDTTDFRRDCNLRDSTTLARWRSRAHSSLTPRSSVVLVNGCGRLGGMAVHSIAQRPADRGEEPGG